MAEELFTVKQLADEVGITKNRLAGRIKCLHIEPSTCKWIKGRFVRFYPRSILSAWQDHSRSQGWYALLTITSMIDRKPGMTERFLKASGWETREQDGRTQWRVPDEMLDVEKFKAAFEAWKRDNYQRMPVHGGGWIRMITDPAVRDMVLKERENRKMAGKMVSVRLRTGLRIRGTVECYNMIGIAIRTDGETLEYKMNQIDTVEAEQR